MEKRVSRLLLQVKCFGSTVGNWRCSGRRFDRNDGSNPMQPLQPPAPCLEDEASGGFVVSFAQSVIVVKLCASSESPDAETWVVCLPVVRDAPSVFARSSSWPKFGWCCHGEVRRPPAVSTAAGSEGHSPVPYRRSIVFSRISWSRSRGCVEVIFVFAQLRNAKSAKDEVLRTVGDSLAWGTSTSLD